MLTWGRDFLQNFQSRSYCAYACLRVPAVCDTIASLDVPSRCDVLNLKVCTKGLCHVRGLILQSVSLSAFCISIPRDGATSSSLFV